MTKVFDHGFITEAEVIETWPMIPATDVRRARRKGDLPFYQFPGGPHYRAKDVEAFIERTYRRGPPAAQTPGAPSPKPEPANSLPTAPSDTLKPARPMSPRPQLYETMAAEEARIQREAVAKRQSKAASPPEAPVPSPSAPHEMREEEINRLRLEEYEKRIANRPTVSQRKRAEAAAAVKRAKAKAKR